MAWPNSAGGLGNLASAAGMVCRRGRRAGWSAQDGGNICLIAPSIGQARFPGFQRRDSVVQADLVAVSDG
jgi:hypothetical protein